VEKVVVAGEDALRTNPTFRAFLGSLGGPALAAPSATTRP